MTKRMNRIAKQAGLSVVLSACLSAHAFSADMKELNQELEIMTGVLDTVLKQHSKRQEVRYRKLDATYLLNQGVVFEVTTTDTSAGWGGWSEIMSLIPPAPLAHISIMDGDEDIEIVQEWESIAENAIREVEESFRETHEELRELRDRSREMAWERRELDRQKRDLEFELRQAQDKRQKEIREDLNELEQELAQLDSKEREIKQHADEIEQRQQAKLEQQKQAQQQAYKTFLANFESSIGDALCRFGAGLRELPDNEHISFVLKDFSLTTQGRERNDRVYVFSKSKVKQCASEKIDESKLLASAQVYEF
ncbi:hypothetical protein DXV75_04120 [Alteromonas aestuariivivens]|uniref:Uncharacterized protein n=1 Tax=Alteromonas aestuariivivens TaxID=1938339 RepID=A0A3D8MCD0_9ALTE|nr:hypothetical protein [Alteromonas aestuariivivens]RDV28156.1 hypothetical protein DXV75_04120 [Alteromonas aestuariivivens]